MYLSVETVEDYGLLVNQQLCDMLEGGGDREVFGAENKRHPADFVLWKLAKPGEPSWPSPWGDGRPGWHSECVVMSLDLLGEGFDLHCGGMDLKFPHHENERAQAVALGQAVRQPLDAQRVRRRRRGREDVEEPRQRRQPARPHRALRPARLPHAVAAVALPRPGRRSARTTSTRRSRRSPVSTRSPSRAAGVAAADADAAVLAEFRERMDDDLDTPGAMALLFDTVRRANAALDAGDPDRGGAGRRGARDLRRVRSRAERRRRRAGRGCGQGRRARCRSRRQGLRHRRPMRAELQAEGWTVETTKAGTTLRR